MRNKNKKILTGILVAMTLISSVAVFRGEISAAQVDAVSSATQKAPASKTTNKKVIGTSKAKQNALADAGLKSSDVTFTKAKLKTDDGVRYYDIKFHTGSAKYEYEVEAYKGTIFEKEVKKVKKATTNKSYIGVNKAKEIALTHAGVSASKADFIKAKLDKDDGKRVYEVEFYQGTMEYEYTIDAYTGKILEWDMEYDD